MFELRHFHIMDKNTNLSGQPVICQLLSFIPTVLIKECLSEHQSDYYYKVMTTYRQLVFLLYGVISRCHSLRNLCKALLFLEEKLSYLGIDSLPASCTLSDANINRSSDVFGRIYHSLYNHYSSYLSDSYIKMFIEDEVDSSKVELFDSSAVSLFVEVFKGAGRNSLDGKKSSVYEGGHRVPFFIHWPEGGLTNGRDVASLTTHIDVLPTLAEICGLKIPEAHRSDGISFKDQLENSGTVPKRDHLIVQFQGGAYFKSEPVEWESICLLKDNWRLITGEELYNIQTDPSQKGDISESNPDKVDEIRALYPPFWESVSPRMTPVSIGLGNPVQNPTRLCSQDWYMPQGKPPWNFGAIKKLPKVTDPWMVNIRQAGIYRITLRQLPADANATLNAVRAKISIVGIEMESLVEDNGKGVVFEMELPVGKTELITYLYDEAGGAYFTDVEALNLNE